MAAVVRIKVVAAVAAHATNAADAADAAAHAARKKCLVGQTFLSAKMCVVFPADKNVCPTAMEPTKELADAIYWERVERARQTPPADRVLASLQQFEFASKIMAAGIRSQFPDADERRVQEILRERLAMSRRLEYPA